MMGMARLFSKFRWWLLVAYTIGWATIWSLCVAYLSRLPPGRETLGDDGYTSAWRGIVIGGAVSGATIYLITLSMPHVIRRFQRPTEPPDSAS